MKIRHCIILLLGAIMCSCVTTKKVNYLQEPSRRIPSYADTISYADYVLRKGDRLYVRVYSLDEKITSLFNGGQSVSNSSYYYGDSNGNIDLYTYKVDDNGNIQYPTLGDVYVRGLTTREVKHLLEDRLSDMIVTYGEMSNISVDVQVVMRTFSFIGVNRTSKVTIPKEKLTIFEALALTGNVGDFGDRHQVHIIRELEDSTVIKTFDVRSADIINSEFYYVEPNDVIYIQQRRGSSFGINSAGTAISVVASTLSFGVFIYTLVDRFVVRPIKNSKTKNSNTN